jgi:hypothetical protein
MVKRADLERHLRRNGARPLREGAKHSIWTAPSAARPVSVPRHRQIPRMTARAICRQLGVPDL